MSTPTLTVEKLKSLDNNQQQTSSNENSSYTKDSSSYSDKMKPTQYPKLYAKNSNERKKELQNRNYKRTKSQGFDMIDEDQADDFIETETDKQKFGLIDRENKFKLGNIDEISNSLLQKRSNNQKRARSLDKLDPVEEEEYNKNAIDQPTLEKSLSRKTLNLQVDKDEFNESKQKSPIPILNRKYSLQMNTNLKFEETIQETIEENAQQKKETIKSINNSQHNSCHSPMHKIKVDELDLNRESSYQSKNFAGSTFNQSEIQEVIEKEEIYELIQKNEQNEITDLFEKKTQVDEIQLQDNRVISEIQLQDEKMEEPIIEKEEENDEEEDEDEEDIHRTKAE